MPCQLLYWCDVTSAQLCIVGHNNHKSDAIEHPGIFVIFLFDVLLGGTC